MTSPRLIGFVHGIDPASQGDYYTDVVHMLTEKPQLGMKLHREEARWVPYLVDIKRLHKRDPMTMVDMQIKQFNRFPPIKAVIDTTREDFLADAFVKKYGESVIMPLHFGNTGQTNTKFSLKQIGYAYIHAGYEWPDVSQIEVKFPKFAKLLRILKKEMMREITTFTDNDRVTFKHPLNKHNDLVHGWEMSLMAAMEYQKTSLGYEKKKIDNNEYTTILQQIYKSYPSSRDITSEPIYDQLLPGSAFGLK